MLSLEHLHRPFLLRHMLGGLSSRFTAPLTVLAEDPVRRRKAPRLACFLPGHCPQHAHARTRVLSLAVLMYAALYIRNASPATRCIFTTQGNVFKTSFHAPRICNLTGFLLTLYIQNSLSDSQEIIIPVTRRTLHGL